MTDAYSAIIAIGKQGQYEREAEVAAVLESPDPVLRGAAIRVLGFYWRRPAYRARAIEMARTPGGDEEERSAAMLAWGAYEHGTRSPEALAGLLAIMLEPDAGMLVHSGAYQTLLVVGGLSPPERARVNSGLVPDRVDWNLIKTLLEGTGVPLPMSVPRARPSNRLGVSRVTCMLGAVTLDFEGDDELVTMRQELGTIHRQWLATLPWPTWEHLIGTLERVGVATSESTTVAWRRRGNLEALALSEDGHAAVERIVQPIIAQLAPDLVTVLPASWFTDETAIESPFEVT